MNLFEELALPGAYQSGSVSDFYVDASTLKSSLGSPAQTHPTTVSPADLWNLDAITSAPASTAFSPLDTPATSYLESPDLSSGYNTTPYMDENADADLGPDTPLMPLFPEDNLGHFAAEPYIASNDSYEFLSELNTSAAAVAVPQPSPMVRQKSSPGRPPIVHDQKASLSAGIQKANSLKHRKELSKIVIDSEDDKETAKRKKNTAAARKSRQRRNETMSAMAAEIARLRNIVKSLGADPDDFP